METILKDKIADVLLLDRFEILYNQLLNQIFTEETKQNRSLDGLDGPVLDLITFTVASLALILDVPYPALHKHVIQGRFGKEPYKIKRVGRENHSKTIRSNEDFISFLFSEEKD